MTITRTSILLGNRLNRDKGELEPLANSIEALGVIQPIVLADNNDGTFELVAGSRRLAACDILGIEEFHEALTCSPGKCGFVFQSNLREDQKREIELDENLQRLGMKWTEEILLVERIHTEKMRIAHLDPEAASWGMRQTGALLNMSFGKVQRALTVAELIRANDKDIMACNNLTECLKVLAKRAGDLAAAELAKRSNMGGMASNDLLALMGLSDQPALPADTNQPTVSIQNGSGQVTLPKPGERLVVPLTSRMFLGNSVNDIMPRMPAESVDHIFSDIPYGVDMDNFEGMRNIERVEKEHDVAENVGLMEGFLKQSFRLMKQNGYLIFFYDLDHHEKLQAWATQAGFAVQRWPLTWCKTHRCRNMAAGFNFTKTEEWAMVCRKGNAVLNKPQPLSRIEADGSVERKYYLNPFAKPLRVWQWLFEAVALKGQTILDPFAGECSCPRAAVLWGLTPISIELNPAHFNAGVQQVREAYKSLTGGNVDFT